MAEYDLVPAGRPVPRLAGRGVVVQPENQRDQAPCRSRRRRSSISAAISAPAVASPAATSASAFAILAMACGSDSSSRVASIDSRSSADSQNKPTGQPLSWAADGRTFTQIPGAPQNTLNIA